MIRMNLIQMNTVDWLHGWRIDSEILGLRLTAMAGATEQKQWRKSFWHSWKWKYPYWCVKVKSPRFLDGLMWAGLESPMNASSSGYSNGGPFSILMSRGKPFLPWTTGSIQIDLADSIWFQYKSIQS